VDKIHLQKGVENGVCMSEKLSEKEKKYLLGLARKAITEHLKNGRTIDVKPAELPSEKLIENGACFVTLKINDELRGCIGTLEAHRPLVMDVIDNAINSAFSDPRFYPLNHSELEKIKISISVLTKPKPLPISGPDDLLNKLVPHKHGLILKQGYARATFLPVVWEQLPDKKEFLEHLSMKAGLAKDGWKSPATSFEVYEAVEFTE
jgi:AmmeMemoRadiSam system protein A